MMSAPVFAMGRFCWPWLGAVGGVCATWGTTIGVTWVTVGGHAWEGKIKLVNIFVGLLSVVEGESGPDGHGGWDGSATASSHGHHSAGLV